METNVPFGAAAEVYKVGFEGPAKHVAVVSVVWHQSQEWLQMEGSIRSAGVWWAARPDSASEAFAGTDFGRMAETNSTLAPKASELGESQARRAVAQGISPTKSSVRADDRQVAQADEIESLLSAPILARAATAPPKADIGYAE